MAEQQLHLVALSNEIRESPGQDAGNVVTRGFGDTRAALRALGPDAPLRDDLEYRINNLRSSPWGKLFGKTKLQLETELQPGGEVSKAAIKYANKLLNSMLRWGNETKFFRKGYTPEFGILSYHEWVEYRHKQSDMGMHPLVPKQMGLRDQTCVQGWLQHVTWPNGMSREGDPWVLPRADQIEDHINVELHSELAMLVDLWYQGMTKEQRETRGSGGGDAVREQWMSAQMTHVYNRIREHSYDRSVDREMPGATAVVAAVIGMMLGSPSEEVAQVQDVIRTGSIQRPPTDTMQTAEPQEKSLVRLQRLGSKRW